jgi:hypothetical protein
MSPEEKSLLERTYKMTEENNAILKSIRNSNRWIIAYKILYWVIILGLSFGAYYSLKPYMETLFGAYGQLQGEAGGIQNISSTLSDLLK